MTTNRTKRAPVFRNLADLPKNGDQRVRRTRARLGKALVQLIVEKPFETITVQDVLDRAQASRSTFYTHFRDKNDLFLSEVDEFLEGMANALSQFGDRSERVAPVEELFAHLHDVRPFYNALVASGRIQDVWELGREHFGRGIERRLAEIPCAHRVPRQERAAVAYGLAGSLFSLLSWWIHHGMTPSPKEMDALFHRMVWSGAGTNAG